MKRREDICDPDIFMVDCFPAVKFTRRFSAAVHPDAKEKKKKDGGHFMTKEHFEVGDFNQTRALFPPDSSRMLTFQEEEDLNWTFFMDA